VIYIDSSVALAYVLAETRIPPAHFWNSSLVSSRLLEYELWNRVHARQPDQSRRAEVHALLAGVQLIDLSEAVLARALVPFAVPVRTLDGLHLATADYLHRHEPLELATYDNRLRAAALAIGIPLAEL
jgi:hypothetical protein